MARSGCIAWYVGVESGSQRVLNFFKKGETLEQFKKTFQLARDNGIKTYASYIGGAPTETEEELKQTLDFSKELKADFRSFNVFVGLPGSFLYGYMLENRLYKYKDKRGLLYGRNHDKLSRLFYGRECYQRLIPRFLFIKKLFKNYLYSRDNIRITSCFRKYILDLDEAEKIIKETRAVELENVKFIGYGLKGNELELFFLCKKRMRQRCVIFVHAYPCDMRLLPDDRREIGFVNMDQQPRISTTWWAKNRVYVETVELSRLFPGSYVLRFGLYDGKRKMRAVGQGEDSIVIKGLIVPKC